MCTANIATIDLLDEAEDASSLLKPGDHAVQQLRLHGQVHPAALDEVSLRHLRPELPHKLLVAQLRVSFELVLGELNPLAVCAHRKRACFGDGSERNVLEEGSRHRVNLVRLHDLGAASGGRDHSRGEATRDVLWRGQLKLIVDEQLLRVRFLRYRITPHMRGTVYTVALNMPPV